MLIVSLAIVLLVGFVTSLSNAVINLDAATKDWTAPVIDKYWLLLKSMFWAVLTLLAAGGLLQAIVESNV